MSGFVAPRLAALAPLAAVFALAAPGCADPYFEATTVLEDTADTAGPYVVQTVAVGVEPSDRVQLYYSVDDDAPESFVPLLMGAGGGDGLYEGERFSRGIPGQAAGSEILYYVAIERDGAQVAADPVGGDLRPFLFRIRQ